MCACSPLSQPGTVRLLWGEGGGIVQPLPEVSRRKDTRFKTLVKGLETGPPSGKGSEVLGQQSKVEPSCLS